MISLCLLNDYKDIKDCVYKGEHYSVRDNGAVLRYSRTGKRKGRTMMFGHLEKPMNKQGIWR